MKPLRLQREKLPPAVPALIVPGPGLRVMVSGPMTGIPHFNRPLFNEVAAQLRGEGHTVYNPATLPVGWTHDHYMAITLGWIERVDALYMLDGWQNSKGAVMEFDRILRNRIPILMFQTVDAFRAAVERSPKLRASLVHWESSMGGPEHAQR